MSNKASGLGTSKTEYAVKLLGILCPLIYFASYLTRKNYSIVMDAIISSEGIGAGRAGLVETCGVVSYGVGQIISGILGDRFKPHRIIICGLSVTMICNIIMPFSPEGLRFVIWFVNGFAQSMLWPPLVRIMSAYMDRKRYNTVAANVNVAGICGAIFVYLTSSLIWLKYFDSWKMTFYSSAVLTGVVLIAWNMGFKKISGAEVTEGNCVADDSTNPREVTACDGAKQKEYIGKITGNAIRQEESAGKRAGNGKHEIKQRLTAKFLLRSGFVFIALAIIVQGALRDGITDWVPTLLRNTFQISSNNAILFAVAIPIFGAISMKLVGICANRWVKDELRASAVIFLAAAVLAAGLYLIYRNDRLFTVLLAALIVGCMHAVNFFLVCVVPTKFERFGLVSTMSGIINSLTYVGTSAAVAGFPRLIKAGNWDSCILSWIPIAAAGAVLCLIAAKSWKVIDKTTG